MSSKRVICLFSACDGKTESVPEIERDDRAVCDRGAKGTQKQVELVGGDGSKREGTKMEAIGD